MKPTIHKGEFHVAGQRVHYRLHRVARRRHVQVIIADDGSLDIRAPYHFPQASVAPLLERHGAWITESLNQVNTLRAQRPTLESGAPVPFLGDTLSLVIRQGATIQCHRTNNRLWLQAPSVEPLALCAALERWYRKQASIHLPARLNQLAANLGVYPTKVTIRGQKSRWGSCSSRGHISLNWKLMVLHPELVDYVLIHELCHLRHMNHSPRFWAMVESAMPDYQVCRRRLRTVRISLVL